MKKLSRDQFVAAFKKIKLLALDVDGVLTDDSIFFGPDGAEFKKFNISDGKYPTVILGYEKGFSASIDDYNFDQIKFRMTQGLNIDDKGRFAYNIKAGKFFNGEDIAFMDYQHFNGNQTNIGVGSYLNVFNNLPYYALSTNDSYLEMHAEHDFNGFLLGRVPLLKKLNFNLILGAHALSTPDQKPYQEYTKSFHYEICFSNFPNSFLLYPLCSRQFRLFKRCPNFR